MADTGWLDPSSASTTGSGITAWSNTSHVLTENTITTSAFVGSTPYIDPSATLTASNFGASIPSGATIDGIEVRLLNRYGTSFISDFMRDHRLQLNIGGSATGDNKANTSTNWTNTSTTDVTYGGATDKWGLTSELTDANINASGFGVEFQVTQTGSTIGLSAYIDCIQTKIHYTEGGGGYSLDILPASYAQTGGTLNLLHNKTLTISPASYVVTGGTLDMAKGFALNVEPASYATSGGSLNLLHDKKLSLLPASYTMNGGGLSLNHNKILNLQNATYTTTGGTLSLTKGYNLSISPATYSTTGGNISLIHNRILFLTSTSYIQTNNTLNLLHNRIFPISPASYTTTGGTLTMTKSTGYNLSILPASYTTSGGTLSLSHNRILSILPASYTTSGGNVSMNKGFTLSLLPASYTQTNNTLNLLHNRTLPILPASYSTSGGELSLLKNYRLSVLPASYTTTGGDLSLLKGYSLAISNATYTQTEGTLSLLNNKKISITPALYATTGGTLTMITGSSGSFVLSILPASYTMTGGTFDTIVSLTLYGTPAIVKPRGLIASMKITGEETVVQETLSNLGLKTALYSTKELLKLRNQTVATARLKNVCDYQINDTPAPVQVFDSVEEDQKKIDFYADSEKAYRFGLCYQTTGQEIYAIKSQEIIDAWVQTLRRVEGTIAQGYFNFHIGYFVLAGTWVRGVNGWNGNAFEDWLTDRFYILSRSERPNNIGTWGLFMETSIASYTNDPQKLRLCADKWQTFIMAQIDENGVLTEEVERTGGDGLLGESGLSYSNFSMLPFTLVAEVLKKEGFNLYTTLAGNRFELAYKQLAEWILNPASFPYYSGDLSQMTSPWQVTYFYILNKYYTDTNAQTVISQKQNQIPNSFLLDLIFGYHWNPTSDISGID